MIWADLLTMLDEARGLIRKEPIFLKTPRATVPKDHPVVEALGQLVEELFAEASPKIVSIELDRHGKPIIPDDMRDLFATIPEGYEAPVVRSDPNAGTGVIRRNPVIGAAPQLETAKKAIATMLPRDTPRIEHPIDLEDANESTVAK
jgi:hypothetical protein